MEIPPVLRLLAEALPLGVLRDPQRLKRVLSDRALLRDLSAQAEYSLGSYPYPGSARIPGDPLCAFFAPTALNPFSTEAKCNDYQCRRTNMQSVATLASLFTDFIAVPDEFALFFDKRDRLSASDRVELALAMEAYYELEPLLRTGVIRFSTAPKLMCPHCAVDAHPELERIVDMFWEFFLEEGTARVVAFPGESPEVEIRTALHDGLVSTFDVVPAEYAALRKLVKPGSDEIRRGAMKHLRELLWDGFALEAQLALEHAAVATKCNLIGASTSTVEALTLQAADGKVFAPSELERWRTLRRLELPWISDLTPAQLIELRQRADKALPVFRERLAVEVAASSSAGEVTDAQLQSVVQGLRLEAEQVRSELTRVAKPIGRSGTGIAAVSSIVLTVTAVGTQNVFAGALTSGLATLLMLFHQHGHDDVNSRDAAMAKPGHVLIAAQEILRHAEHK